MKKNDITKIKFRFWEIRDSQLVAHLITVNFNMTSEAFHLAVMELEPSKRIPPQKSPMPYLGKG